MGKTKAPPVEEPPPPEDTESIVSSTASDANIALKCACNGNLERFVKCFENDTDRFHENIAELILERDEDTGRSPLDMAAILGRVEMVQELIKRGADVNSAEGQGYTAAHLCAAWGQIECLKVLVENSSDIQLRTTNTERPREVAHRYNQTECVDYLDWAEAKQDLQNAIQTMKETLADPEKTTGRLNREDKHTTNALCNEKLSWIDKTPEATTQDFLEQKQIFDEALVGIWQKLTEPMQEKAEKTSR